MNSYTSLILKNFYTCISVNLYIIHRQLVHIMEIMCNNATRLGSVMGYRNVYSYYICMTAPSFIKKKRQALTHHKPSSLIFHGIM